MLKLNIYGLLLDYYSILLIFFHILPEGEHNPIQALSSSDSFTAVTFSPSTHSKTTLGVSQSSRFPLSTSTA